jgi:hypothetical protein
MVLATTGPVWMPPRVVVQRTTNVTESTFATVRR